MLPVCVVWVSCVRHFGTASPRRGCKGGGRVTSHLALNTERSVVGKFDRKRGLHARTLCNGPSTICRDRVGIRVLNGEPVVSKAASFVSGVARRTTSQNTRSAVRSRATQLFNKYVSSEYMMASYRCLENIRVMSDCTNCNSQERTAEECSFRIHTEPNELKHLNVVLCERCATEFLDLDWIELRGGGAVTN